MASLRNLRIFQRLCPQALYEKGDRRSTGNWTKQIMISLLFSGMLEDSKDVGTGGKHRHRI